jgi:hypothetical protein
VVGADVAVGAAVVDVAVAIAGCSDVPLLLVAQPASASKATSDNDAREDARVRAESRGRMANGDAPFRIIGVVRGLTIIAYAI